MVLVLLHSNVKCMFFIDGVPKDGLIVEDVLYRIGLLQLIRDKVNERATFLLFNHGIRVSILFNMLIVYLYSIILHCHPFLFVSSSEVVCCAI